MVMHNNIEISTSKKVIAYSLPSTLVFPSVSLIYETYIIIETIIEIKA